MRFTSISRARFSRSYNAAITMFCHELFTMSFTGGFHESFSKSSRRSLSVNLRRHRVFIVITGQGGFGRVRAGPGVSGPVWAGPSGSGRVRASPGESGLLVGEGRKIFVYELPLAPPTPS